MAWLEKRSGIYRVCFRDEAGKTRRIKAYSDKLASKQLMGEMERAIARGERGLLNPYAKHNARPLVAHVAEWVATLRERGKDEEYVVPCDARLLRLAAECEWKTLRSISADGFEHWRQNAVSRVAHNRKGCTKETIVPLGARTKNHYLETLRTFCNWCVKRGRMPANPVAHVEKVEQSQDVRRERRALSEEEVRRLLGAVPEEYRILYRVALCTGLRRSELLELQWGDIKLDDPTPHIQLRAKTTKARRADGLPLRADLVESLRQQRGDAADGDRVFARVPRIKEHKRWLAAAGIAYTDANGRRADIHALRHTYGTLLSKAGVSPREAMELMRHTDLRQTMKVYTDPRIFNLSAAVEKLPTISIDLSTRLQQSAGGGNGSKSNSASHDEPVANRGAKTSSERHSAAVIGQTEAGCNEAQLPDEIQDGRELAIIGSEGKKAGDGIRTHDVSLGKAAFYH